MRKAIRGLFGAGLTVAISSAAALWSPAGMGGTGTGVRPGDENMTCAQIAAELQPYAKQMAPSAMALGQTAQDVRARGETRMAEGAAESAAETAGAQATMLDPTGLASKLYGQAQVQRQKERWQRAEAEDRPLNEKYKAQTEQVVKEGKQLQSNERLQRLMQLAQEKNCH